MNSSPDTAPDTLPWPWGPIPLRTRLSDTFSSPAHMPPGGAIPFPDDPDPLPQAVASIASRTLRDLSLFTFTRTDGQGVAFRVRDYSWLDSVERCEGLAESLKTPRVQGLYRGREIAINELTPSAVTTVLMSAVRDDRSDTFDITAWVLRHHISGRRFFRTPAMAYTPHLAFWQLITYCTITPAAHIQEHKFTLSLAALGRRPGARITNDSPWQLLHIGAPVPRSADHDGDELRLAEWVLDCLVAVRQHWDAVVDEGERVVARKGAAVRVEPGGEMDVVMALRRWRGYVERTKGAMEGIAALTGEQLPAEWEERWACRVGFEFGALERRVGALIARLERERERAAASAAAAAVQAEWAPVVEQQVVAAENNIVVFTISLLPVMAVLIMISCGLLPACITAEFFLACFVSVFSAAGFFLFAVVGRGREWWGGGREGGSSGLWVVGVVLGGVVVDQRVGGLGGGGKGRK